MPKPDLPFDERFLDFARRSLAMAGLEPDKEWLAVRPVRMDMLSAISETGHYYRQAREHVPHEQSHWEQSLFMGSALRCALWDLQQDGIATYAEFAFLYEKLLGTKARPYFRSVFAAACLSPSLGPDRSNQLMRTMPERDDQEID